LIAWFCIRPRRSTRIAVGLVFLCIVGWWITIPEERQQQLEEEISKLQANVDLLKVESFSRQQVMNDPNYLQEAWPRLDQTENPHQQDRDHARRDRNRSLLSSFF
jgi:hypothetical protein